MVFQLVARVLPGGCYDIPGGCLDNCCVVQCCCMGVSKRFSCGGCCDIMGGC